MTFENSVKCFKALAKCNSQETSKEKLDLEQFSIVMYQSNNDIFVREKAW